MRVQIGFCTSSWWVSRVIRAATRAPVSHTYIVFDQIPDVEEEVYEAAWCGFRMSTRPKLTSGSTYIVKEVAVDVDPRAALAICRSWLETPYDYLGLVGEAPVQVGKLFGRRWHNRFAGAHHMFCSEAAAYLLQVVARTSDLKRRVAPLDPRTTSPNDLLVALT